MPTADQSAVDALHAQMARRAGVDPGNSGAQDGESTSLIHGKYKTQEEADKGFSELLKDRTRQEDRANALEAKVAQLTAALTGGNVAQNDPDEELGKRIAEEAVIDPKLLSAFVERVADKVLVARLDPALKLAQVDQAMVETYGRQYLDDLPQLNEFIEETPRVKQFVDMAREAGRPELGRQYAYEAMRHANGEDLEVQNKSDAEAAKERRAFTRTHAQVLGKSSRSNKATLPGSPLPNKADLAGALRSAQSGNWKSFDDMFIKPFMPSQEQLDAMWSR